MAINQQQGKKSLGGNKVSSKYMSCVCTDLAAEERSITLVSYITVGLLCSSCSGIPDVLSFSDCLGTVSSYLGSRGTSPLLSQFAV